MSIEPVQRRCAIKKHRASRLHYDLRLEFDGVLLSWVIPEGPSCRAGERRMAIEVEDHDPKYLTTERVIPKGRYGAGPIMHWDGGSWVPLQGFENIAKGLQMGYLKFQFNCHKLKGIWTLRRRQAGCQNGRRPVWDLIKEPDAFASSADAPDIVVAEPNSISTGRTLEEIEQDGNKAKPKLNTQMSLFGEEKITRGVSRSRKNGGRGEN